MKKLCILLMACLLCVLPAGCAKEKPADDGPKPWAAPTGATSAAETTEAWTKQEEMETLAALENDGASITLPEGVTAADIEQAEQAFWMAFFYTPLEPSPIATAKDVLPYLTNGAVPWGLLYLYDTFDPAHTHGAYEKLSVADEPDPQALFPDESQKEERDAWTHRLLKNLKTWGPKTLMDAIAEAEEKKIADKERRETVRREASYFRDHEEHMDYRTARGEGVPIGSGAMESQCSQNQNRFKRRGQFWSKGGFASFLEAYVWYTNRELMHLYRRTA